MIDSAGAFIGNVCHIEAASPDGQRYNPNQTDEDRRAFSNLMLMCYPHHITTNNVEQYTVDVLKKIKADHEAKFSDIANIIGKSMTDWTETQFLIKPKNIGKLNELMNWDLDDYQSEESAREISEFLKNLDNVPTNSRRVFSVMLKRLNQKSVGADRVDPRIIEEVMKIDSSELDRHIVLLNNAGLCSRIIPGDYDDDPHIDLYAPQSGWKLWRDVLAFCRKEDIKIEDLIIGLNFKHLES